MSIQARLLAAGIGSLLTLAGGTVYVLEGEENKPYQDIVGVWTVCVGSTGDVLRDKLYSEQECTDRFIKDLKSAENAVNRCTPGLILPWQEPLKAALISFTFNVGNKAYCTSTLAKKINQGDYRGGCEQLHRWVYAGKKYSRGLQNRRNVEYTLCLRGINP